MHILIDSYTVSALPGFLAGPFGCLPPQGDPWGGPKRVPGRPGPPTQPFGVPNGPLCPCEAAGVQNLTFGPSGASWGPLNHFLPQLSYLVRVAWVAAGVMN